jgi:uncharacterized DUF497 family protein
MRLDFAWDTLKAESNLAKHGVSFEDAMTVFLDPRALTIFDEEHSDDEERWITLGEAVGPKLLLVVHTHVEVSDDLAIVRIISARRPNRKEAGQYRQGSIE